MHSHQSTSSEGRSTIVITSDDGDVDIVTDSHPNFVRIAQALRNGEDVTTWLKPTTEWFQAQYDDADDDEDDTCYDCGDFLDDCVCDITEDDDDDFEPAVYIESLSETIERYRREGRDATGLVRFMNRLAKNPSRRSREQLFTWTQAKDLTVDADGFIVGFKGVQARHTGTDEFPLDRYSFQSSSSGHGFVDGSEVVNGNLPMGVGAVLTIPRDEVQDDPNIGCHVGLHVGTHAYATGFAPVLVEVRFDPADVVSVPSDSGFAKLRCCRYEVVAIHDLNDDDLSAHEAEATWNEEESFDSFMQDTFPQGFAARLKARILRRGDR